MMRLDLDRNYLNKGLLRTIRIQFVPELLDKQPIKGVFFNFFHH